MTGSAPRLMAVVEVDKTEKVCRTLTNMFEVMVRTHAKKPGVAASIPPSRAQGAKRQPGGSG
jgi:hypothetical protein